MRSFSRVLSGNPLLAFRRHSTSKSVGANDPPVSFVRTAGAVVICRVGSITLRDLLFQFASDHQRDARRAAVRPAPFFLVVEPRRPREEPALGSALDRELAE